MRVVPLGEDYAPAIEELARGFYPPEFHLDQEQVAENLRLAEEEGSNLSLGLERGGTLAGYMLAWLESSRLEGRQEQVVLIDDLVAPGEARGYLKSLFSALAEELLARELGDLALEAAVRSQERGVLAGHRRFLESLGYEQVAELDYEDPDFGEELTWVRYEPWSLQEYEQAHDDTYGA